MISVDPEQGGPGGHSILLMAPRVMPHKLRGVRLRPGFLKATSLLYFYSSCKRSGSVFCTPVKKKKCMSSSQFMQLIMWTLNNFTVFPPEKIIF